jgi:plasmid stabilization system protein ParE
MSYRVLRTAENDLRSIDDWVRGQFGNRVAERVFAEFLTTFQLLDGFQHMGSAKPRILPAPYRFYALRMNWIIYKPGSPLTIHRVVSGRTDLLTLHWELGLR